MTVVRSAVSILSNSGALGQTWVIWSGPAAMRTALKMRSAIVLGFHRYLSLSYPFCWCLGLFSAGSLALSGLSANFDKFWVLDQVLHSGNLYGDQTG